MSVMSLIDISSPSSSLSRMTIDFARISCDTGQHSRIERRSKLIVSRSSRLIFSLRNCAFFEPSRQIVTRDGDSGSHRDGSNFQNNSRISIDVADIPDRIHFVEATTTNRKREKIMSNYTTISIYLDGVWSGSGKITEDGEIVDCGAQFCDDNDRSLELYEEIEDAIQAGEDELNIDGVGCLTWSIVEPVE